MLATESPYGQFFDLDGTPLTGGSAYYGAAGLNPLTNPIPVFWDSAGTAPASQPIKTLNGYPIRSGTPALVFANQAYSLLVVNKKGQTVYYLQDSADLPSNLGVLLAGTHGGSLINWQRTEAGSVLRTIESKLYETVSVLDFGAVGDGVSNDTDAIQAAINTGKAVYFPQGTYLCNVTLTEQFRLHGDGIEKTILKAWNTALPIVKNLYDSTSWDYSSVTDIAFRGVGLVGVGFSFGDPAGYVAGHEFIGRVIFTRCKWNALHQGVFKTCGNIGNTFTDCWWTNNHYGVYAQDSARVGGGTMHPFADSYHRGHFDFHSRSAVLYMSRTGGSAQLIFYGTIIESNQAFAITIDCVGTFGPSFICDGTWFENNATDALATTETYSGTHTGPPQDVFLMTTRNFHMRNTVLGKIKLVDSHLTTEDCDTLIATGPTRFGITRDSTSTVIHKGSQSDFWGDAENLTLAPYANQQASAGPNQNTPAYSTLPSGLVAGSDLGTVLFASHGTNARTLFGNTGNLGATIVPDGMSRARCQQLALTATARYLVINAGAAFAETIPVVLNSWYVITAQIRRVSGSGVPTLQVTGASTLGTAVSIDHDDWRQYTWVVRSSVGPSTTQIRLNYDASNAATVRLGEVQVVTFFSHQDAANYAYSGRMAEPPDSHVEVKSATFPFSGQTSSPYRVSFNSANYCVNGIAGGGAYTELFRCQLGGAATSMVVELLGAFIEDSTGAAQTQDTGWRSIAFATVASTPTSVFGAATLTFRWTLITGSTYALEASITAGAATSLAMTGIAFVKGR